MNLAPEGSISIMLTSCKSIKKKCTQPGAALMQCHATCKQAGVSQAFDEIIAESVGLLARLFICFPNLLPGNPSSVAKYQVFKR